MADKNAAREDAAIKAQRVEEMTATFTTADSNADGLLDKAEFANFMQMASQNAAARDCPHMTEADIAEEDKETIWAYFNA